MTEPQAHIHDYNNKWKCKCGQRLIFDPRCKTSAFPPLLRCITSGGKTIDFQAIREENKKNRLKYQPKINEERVQLVNEMLSSGGFTEEQVADKTGVSLSSVSRIATGQWPRSDQP